MTICGAVLLMRYGGTASVSPRKGLGVRNAAFSLLHVHLRRQRCADRRLVGPIEVVRASGCRSHRPPCGDQGRDVTADRSGIAIWWPRPEKEHTTAVG